MATDDSQWIHVDAERAARGPFGTTIAHGFLTLSLCVPMLSEVLPRSSGMVVNYGVNRVRFPGRGAFGATRAWPLPCPLGRRGVARGAGDDRCEHRVRRRREAGLRGRTRPLDSVLTSSGGVGQVWYRASPRELSPPSLPARASRFRGDRVRARSERREHRGLRSVSAWLERRPRLSRSGRSAFRTRSSSAETSSRSAVQATTSGTRRMARCPPALPLATDGTLSGMPIQAGTFAFWLELKLPDNDTLQQQRTTPRNTSRSPSTRERCRRRLSRG